MKKFQKKGRLSLSRSFKAVLTRTLSKRESKLSEAMLPPLNDYKPDKNTELKITLTVELLQKLTEFLSDNALHVEGIFRISGNSAIIKQLYERLADPKEFDLWAESADYRRPHNVAGALSRALRQDPPITPEFYNLFTSAYTESIENRITALRSAINLLLVTNRQILYYVISLLKKISDNSARNKMTVKNLSAIFGQSLMRAPDGASIDAVQLQSGIIELLISNVDSLFTVGSVMYSVDISFP